MCCKGVGLREVEGDTKCTLFVLFGRKRRFFKGRNEVERVRERGVPGGEGELEKWKRRLRTQALKRRKKRTIE